MTNREKLMQMFNAMSNKELSEAWGIPCKVCPASEYCNTTPDEMNCNEVMESWLNEGEKKDE